MFSCRNCTKNLIRTVFAISAEEQAQILRLGALQSRSLQKTRTISSSSKQRASVESTSTTRSPHERTRIEAGLPVDVQTYKEAAAAALRGNEAIRRFKREPATVESPVPIFNDKVSVLDGKTPIDIEQLRKHARMELKYIDEPFRLAERSLIMLKNGQVDQTLEMVRMAGKEGINTTVSWNHILNTVTKAGHLDVAWKLFNEMKKLGQKPDSYTIILLLRGYSQSKKGLGYKLNTASQIYDSIFAPNSAVKPHIFHSNAMLEACARASDIERMFSIAAKLPNAGPNSPTDATYTIIFNALANATPRKGEDEHEQRQLWISQARRVWPDILNRWTKGGLVMSEKLVCSMGRLLLTSDSGTDQDDVFALVQQTMRIPRQFDSLRDSQISLGDGSQDALSNKRSVAQLPEPRHEMDDPKSLPGMDLNELFDDQDDWQQPGESSGNDLPIPWSSEPNLDEGHNTPNFRALKGADSGLQTKRNAEKSHNREGFQTLRSAGLVFARPGTNTLSLLLKACSSSKQYDAATKYWDLLKEQVTPDAVNYIDYLELLKERCASSLATDVLKDIYKQSKSPQSNIRMIPRFFWHSLSACVRAKHTSTALRDATRILAILQMSAAEPEIQMVELYNDILGRANANVPPEDIERAVETLMITFGNLKSLCAFGRTIDNGPSDPSVSLSEMIRDIDPKWQPPARRVRPRPARSRQDVMTEVRTLIPMDERGRLRNLGHSIEVAVGRVLRIHWKSLSQDQITRIRVHLRRVREWLFPRNQEWKTELPTKDTTEKFGPVAV